MDSGSLTLSLLDGPCFGDLPSSQSSDASSSPQIPTEPAVVEEPSPAFDVPPPMIPESSVPTSHVSPNIFVADSDTRVDDAQVLESSEEAILCAYIQANTTPNTDPAVEAHMVHIPLESSTPGDLCSSSTAENDPCPSSVPCLNAEDSALGPDCSERVESTSSGSFTSSPHNNLHSESVLVPAENSAVVPEPKEPLETAFLREECLEAEDEPLSEDLDPNEIALASLDHAPMILAQHYEPPSSSPPSSSPDRLFSSSPPRFSDSSNEDTDVKMEEKDDHPPSPMRLLYHILEEAQGFELPPSSSPSRSSSPIAIDNDEESVPETSTSVEMAVQEEEPPAPIVPELKAMVEIDEELKPEPRLDEESRLEEVLRTALVAHPPNPRRPTARSRQEQRQLLIKPFRPLTIVKKPESNPAPLLKPAPAKKEPNQNSVATIDMKPHRTQRASAQFKSPLPSSSASLSSCVRPTPTIQTLERRLQVLRRAVKLTEDGDAETLGALVTKWTDAGREIAWEVWGLVKDNETTAMEVGGSGKRKLNDSWGWGDDNNTKKLKMEERNWGWDTAPAAAKNEEQAESAEEEGDDVTPKETMGMMLLRLGIALETLGWNEEEGEFVDVEV